MQDGVKDFCRKLQNLLHEVLAMNQTKKVT